MRHELTPLLQAGLLIVAVALLKRLDLARPTVAEILSKLKVSSSRAYELAKSIEAAVIALHRPPGRPNKPAVEVPDDHPYRVACQVRDYLFEHPGCASGDKRRCYNEGFKNAIFDMAAPGGVAETMALPVLSEATGVPQKTLADWLRNNKITTPQSASPPPGSGLATGVIEQIIALRRQWVGNLAAFRMCLRDEHRIAISWHRLRQILTLAGFYPKKRGRPGPDAEAIRGALERFFPGAQLMADGKLLIVQLGQRFFRVNWELAVDAATGGFMGFDVSATEDSDALLASIDMAAETAGEPPLAVLVDNKPSNLAENVVETLDVDDVLLMAATENRPQNKSTCEGAFGLFAQTMPNIFLPTVSAEALVHAVIWHVLFAYCAGRNQAPRVGLGGRSVIDAFAEADVTDEERRQARERLAEINDRIERQRDADRQRTDPVCRQIVARKLAELQLDDPQHLTRDALARCGIDAALEALAVFTAKRDVNILPADFPERYLAGIGRNIAQRDEDFAVYDHLVDLRLAADDLLLRPLVVERDILRDQLDDLAFFRSLLDQVCTASATIDRRFWSREMLLAFEGLEVPLRREHQRWLARRIAVAYSVPAAERDHLIARIATPIK